MNTKFQFFSKKEINLWDKGTLALYIIITIIISFLGLMSTEIIIAKDVIYGYAFCTPIFIYLFQYKSLRNIYLFIIWVVISLYHLILFSKIESKSDYILPNGNHVGLGLKTTFLLLLLMFLLRISSIMIQKKELVAPVYFGFSRDTLDNRKITVYDYIFFVIFVFAWLNIT